MPEPLSVSKAYWVGVWTVAHWGIQRYSVIHYLSAASPELKESVNFEDTDPELVCFRKQNLDCWIF